MFKVNKANDFITQSRILKEARAKGDLIAVKLHPDYHLLTVQLLMAFVWVNDKCMGVVDYVLKVDDDTFVHLEAMEQYMKTVINSKPSNVSAKSK